MGQSSTPTDVNSPISICSPLTLVVPFRGMHAAKTRLATLGETTRQQFARSCFKRTLMASVAASGVRTVVLTNCRDTQLLAERLGAEWMNEGSIATREATASRLPFRALLRNAIQRVSTDTPAGLLMADLPFVSSQDIELAYRSLNTHEVVVAGDVELAGTNLLLMRNPDPELVQFNSETSYRQHCRAAQARGLTLMTVRAIGLEFDVDTPADFRAVGAGDTNGPSDG